MEGAGDTKERHVFGPYQATMNVMKKLTIDHEDAKQEIQMQTNGISGQHKKMKSVS